MVNLPPRAANEAAAPGKRFIPPQRSDPNRPLLLTELPPGLPNPSQLSERLDWEVTHLNETIWKAFDGRDEARRDGSERRAALRSRTDVGVWTPR